MRLDAAAISAMIITALPPPIASAELPARARSTLALSDTLGRGRRLIAKRFDGCRWLLDFWAGFTISGPVYEAI